MTHHLQFFLTEEIATKVTNRLKKFTRSLVILTLTGFVMVTVRPAFAQLDLDAQKIASVISVVTTYLLGDREPSIEEPTGERVDLSLNELINTTYNVTKSNTVYAAFDSQNESVELCFDINVNTGNFVVELNGDVVNAVVGNDNCYVLSQNQQREINYITISTTTSGASIDVDRFGLSPSYQESANGLQKVTRGGWDERAVRKVLKIFAFGGHATDAQIQAWADMDSLDAIQEMLNFDKHNEKLSPLISQNLQIEPYIESADENLNLGTLQGYYDFISSESSNLPLQKMPESNIRYQLSIDGYRMADTFGRMATTRGLNPFRQRIGFWETNYHLAINIDTDVSREQAVYYYDLIMEAHEDRLPYKDILGIAAKSAAIATQYAHRFNSWDENNQVCYCNDDFAREIHQLFYGIFGVDDPDHEDVTIPETAKMLTDMNVSTSGGISNTVVFESNNHPPSTAALDILGHNILGGNASERIDNLMPLSMQYPESLKNLPIMIIQVLADDNLSESAKTQLRQAWAEMGVDRNFLEFIHSYAISSLFHSKNQFKYFTTFERAFYLANKMNLTNAEAYLGNEYEPGVGRSIGVNVDEIIDDDNVSSVFRPLHNVFGGQNSTEASDSALSFEKNFNRAATSYDWEYRGDYRVRCDTCNNDGPWLKDWSLAIPEFNGTYTSEYVAQWLWNHVVGSLDNYTALERAHLLSILGANAVREEESDTWKEHLFFDLNYLLCISDDRIDQGQTDVSLTTLMSENVWSDYCSYYNSNPDEYTSVEKAAFNLVLTGEDIQNDAAIQSLLNQLSASLVPLDSSDPIQRRRANERVQAALVFISATPFIFAEGDR